MAWYKTGTVTATNGSSVITGVDTRFAANSKVGDGFKGPDGGWYEVVNIASETVLSIYPVYQGTTVSGSSTWMIAPLQGYNKESADRLRAITDSIAGSFVKTVNTRTGDVVLSKTDVGLGNVDNTSDANKPVSTAQQTAINSRQASNANLTAFSGLTGAVDRLPYFTGAGALSLATLTAKARAFNARTDTAGMQSELALVPVTSNIDITADRILKVGSGGILGVPVPLTNANLVGSLAGTRAVFSGTEAQSVAANFPSLGGNSTELRRWFITTDLQDSGSAVQVAVENYGINTIKGRTFVRTLYAGWNAWVELTSVSVSNLDPTLGGIVSYGSNANGEYIKYANGALICWRYVGDATFTAANRYNASWTYPIAFVAIPFVTAQGAGRMATTIQSCTYQVFAQTINSATCAIMQSASSNFDNVRDLTWFAIGRWK